VVVNKGEKLMATGRWEMNGQNVEVIDKFNCVGVMLESAGGWNKDTTLTKS
jgi:archaeosine-15-forming tRNA-guanine transglycosylase